MQAFGINNSILIVSTTTKTVGFKLILSNFHVEVIALTFAELKLFLIFILLIITVFSKRFGIN